MYRTVADVSSSSLSRWCLWFSILERDLGFLRAPQMQAQPTLMRLQPK